jgi:hypothetical protein
MPLAFPAKLHYMRRSLAHGRFAFMTLLDDIPAEGASFPRTDKEKYDVDYC